ncbi:thermonuclease family protein [Rhizobium sp. CFBP 8762]|uniref:thermonuclease family protein n=1 Tax=Rhizobium sp. CFBP 8762 TaxID=2775279 RepID=UPI00177E24A9|nr:thermonuclease family protein [Rhizobium sp. CFBP 8762]MBD8555582.1 thermonuclease family protein [Rhizobium sp. CFBP 8762]
MVDGDTGWQNGKKWRLLDIDTPETSRPECKAEGHTGKAALNRLAGLMANGYQLQYSGSKDRTSDRRDLVRIRLHDGRDAGEVLIQERLAQPWPNTGNIWCNR